MSSGLCSGATKLISNLRNKSYEEWLRILDLRNLKYERIRCAMIETQAYKIIPVPGKDVSVFQKIPIVSDSVTITQDIYP